MFLELNCTPISEPEKQRDIILPDDYMAHKLAFPDTTYLELIGEHFDLLNDEENGKVMVLERFFDINFNKLPNLVVFYRLSSFNDSTGQYEIDSTKAPPAIITNNEKGTVFVYMYRRA